MRYKNSYVQASIDLTMPQLVQSGMSEIKSFLDTLFSQWKDRWGDSGLSGRRIPGLAKLANFFRFNPPFTYKKTGLIVFTFVLLLLLFFAGGKLVEFAKRPPDTRTAIPGAKASQVLNKEKSFPLRNSTGQEVSQIKYFIESAELRDVIVVKGKKATSIKGRTFLILNLKISNEFSQAIEINTRDYLRLSVNGKTEEWLAPDIHNDPVGVQPISIKYTRLGFPINDRDKNLVLRFGEIAGEKEEIPLELK